MNKQEIRLLLEQAEIDNLPLPASPEENEEEYYNAALGAWQDDRGCEYVESGNYEEAEKMFKKSINTYWHCYSDLWDIPPAIYNPYYHLAKCYYFSGRSKDAIKAFLEALEASKSFRQWDSDNYYWHLELDVYIQIGRIYVELGNQEMALFYHEKAVEYLNKQ